MKNAQAILDFENDTLFILKQKLKIETIQSGHYVIPFGSNVHWKLNDEFPILFCKNLKYKSNDEKMKIATKLHK